MSWVDNTVMMYMQPTKLSDTSMQLTSGRVQSLSLDHNVAAVVAGALIVQSI